ncbi:MAG: fasciclin domain-containing protein [Pseudanabaenaceae cyanobacterium SKYGB_i_bin29]|nr:fasciclin domain-containing protein [Pseudanabaenaceae cyanobacterium SKYG29]MDW8421033.1 fasciclin domain-containing protein [Pseudanabaenaceae cyanobacterium SKYGB_i_bin29]
MKNITCAAVFAVSVSLGLFSWEYPTAFAAEIVAKSETGNIVTVASSNKDFSTLVSAIKAAGLVETLSSKGPFTIFAPTNAAFASLPKGTLEKLLRPENKQTLIKVLTYHVVAGEVLSKDVKPGDVKTVEGSNIKVTVMDGKPKVNGANVTTVDVKATNGVIHVIDAVILPPGLKL